MFLIFLSSYFKLIENLLLYLGEDYKARIHSNNVCMYKTRIVEEVSTYSKTTMCYHMRATALVEKIGR